MEKRNHPRIFQEIPVLLNELSPAPCSMDESSSWQVSSACTGEKSFAPTNSFGPHETIKNENEKTSCSESRAKRCKSKNISLGGLCFTSGTPYAPNTILMIRLAIHDWKGYKRLFQQKDSSCEEEYFSAIGKVVWCKKSLNNGDGFHVGFKFINIYEDDLRGLQHYVQNAMHPLQDNVEWIIAGNPGHTENKPGPYAFEKVCRA